MSHMITAQLPHHLSVPEIKALVRMTAFRKGERIQLVILQPSGGSKKITFGPTKRRKQ